MARSGCLKLRNLFKHNLMIVEAQIPLVETMELAEWPALSIVKTMLFCVTEGVLTLIAVENKEVYKLF